MAISGSLKDVSVADVMQFIHLVRRTGTLLLTRGAQRAMIGFHRGRLVSAQAPRTPKLGDLLISSGLLDRANLDLAVQTQALERERRSLGQGLVTPGAIDAEGLRQGLAQQIEPAVSEGVGWGAGTLEVALDDPRAVDDIAPYPCGVLPDADVTTEMVLLEAARIGDERNRGGSEPLLEGVPPSLSPLSPLSPLMAPPASPGAGAGSPLGGPGKAAGTAPAAAVERRRLRSTGPHPTPVAPAAGAGLSPDRD